MCNDEELFRKYCPDFCAGSKCLEPYFSVFQAGMDAMCNEWHYVKDKLPPEPEGKDRKILPKTYICAYRINNAYDDFEIGDFMYLGSGIWNGENKEYPIYAWLASPVDIPEPPKEQDR